MPKDDFVCAGMRQFLSVFGQRSSETCLSCLEQFSHGFDLVSFEFACFIAADEDFEHGAAVAVDEVERAGVFAHKRAFQKVDGGAVFVIDMTVYAAVGFGVVEVVEATADFAAGQFAGDFDDGVGGVGDEGDGFVPGGDGLEDFDDAAAFGLADAVFGQAADDVFKAALVLRGEHFEHLAGIFFQ